jgi:hypothetical protein
MTVALLIPCAPAGGLIRLSNQRLPEKWQGGMRSLSNDVRLIGDPQPRAIRLASHDLSSGTALEPR